MIGYATFGSNDLEQAAKFYDALLAPIGAKRQWTSGKANRHAQQHRAHQHQHQHDECAAHSRNSACRPSPLMARQIAMADLNTSAISKNTNGKNTHMKLKPSTGVPSRFMK